MVILNPVVPLTAFQQALAHTAAHLSSVLPTAASRAIDHGIAQLAAANRTALALVAGQAAPNFTLPDASNQPLTLSALLQQGPVVLTFYRGNWCPYCNVQLRAYQQLLPELARLGATLVAISPQTPDNTRLTATEKGLTFPVLSDVGNAVAQRYGLAYGVGPEVADTLRSVGINLTDFNGTDDDELPLTATFVIDSEGVVAKSWVTADFKQRPEPADVLAAVRGVAQVAA